MSDCETIKKWIKGICLLVILMLTGSVGYSADNRVVKQLNVLGTANIHQQNLAEGRQNAVDDALVAAVGQVVMEMLTDETVVRRFQVINDKILTERENYVQNYRVLTESVSGATIRTLVQVDVAVDKVSRDLSGLGLAMAGDVYPKVLFMVAERKLKDAEFSYWWAGGRHPDRTICEGAMAAVLAATGFEIVDPPALSETEGLVMNAPETDMIALAGRLGADVLVTGYGTAAIAPNTMGGTIKSFEAVVEIRAINVQTGELLGRTRQHSVVSGQDETTGGREALSGAGELAGGELARQVMDAWRQDQGRGAILEVVVEGTGGQIASFVRLRTIISSLSGVRELKMNEMSTDRAVMAVNYQGTARSLADALLLKAFSGFSIDIFSVTPETINIRLVHQ